MSLGKTRHPDKCFNVALMVVLCNLDQLSSYHSYLGAYTKAKLHLVPDGLTPFSINPCPRPKYNVLTPQLSIFPYVSHLHFKKEIVARHVQQIFIGEILQLNLIPPNKCLVEKITRKSTWGPNVISRSFLDMVKS